MTHSDPIPFDGDDDDIISKDSMLELDVRVGEGDNSKRGLRDERSLNPRRGSTMFLSSVP
jgi:hypothetical protein